MTVVRERLEPSGEREDAELRRAHESHMVRFLRWSAYADKQDALEICESHEPTPLWDEMVYILGETQQSKEALGLLLTKVGDVRRAIQFVEDEEDPVLTKELWDDLITFSLAHRDFLTGMLDYAGLYSVELPSRLIREIPANMEIPDLRSKLVRILEDYRFQVSLQQSCRDCMETFYHRERARIVSSLLARQSRSVGATADVG